MKSSLKVGIFTLLTDQSPIPVTDLAIALEERGFESLWLGEHTHIPTSTTIFSREVALAGAARLGDPFVLLAAAAAVTNRLRLGTAVCLAAEREPIQLAHEVATLDMISNGRVELGIGYGGNIPEMKNRGLDPTKRQAILRENVLAMKEIWQNDVASFDGEHVRFSESWSWPKPVQQPHPPISLGCMTSRGFEHVVEFCDGWLPQTQLIPRDDLPGLINRLHETAQDAGRDPAAIQISMLIGADSPALAKTKFAPGDPYTMGLETFRERCLTSDDIEAYASLGVDRIVVTLQFPNADAVNPMLDHLAKQAFS